LAALPPEKMTMPPPRARGVGDDDRVWFSEIVGRWSESANGSRNDIVATHSTLQDKIKKQGVLVSLLKYGHENGLENGLRSRAFSPRKVVDGLAGAKLQARLRRAQHVSGHFPIWILAANDLEIVLPLLPNMFAPH
jgi:hypothetical protein